MSSSGSSVASVLPETRIRGGPMRVTASRTSSLSSSVLPSEPSPSDCFTSRWAYTRAQKREARPGKGAREHERGHDRRALRQAEVGYAHVQPDQREREVDADILAAGLWHNHRTNNPGRNLANYTR